MPGGGGRNGQYVVPQATGAMDQLKYEVAQQLGIPLTPQEGYFGYMATRDTGAVGGNMVRTMIQLAETQLASQAGGFQNQTGSTAQTGIITASAPLGPQGRGGPQGLQGGGQ